MFGHCMGHKEAAPLSGGIRVRLDHGSLDVEIGEQHREPHWEDWTLGVSAPTVSLQCTLPSWGPERGGRRFVQTTFGDLARGRTGKPNLCVDSPIAGAD